MFPCTVSCLLFAVCWASFITIYPVMLQVKIIVEAITGHATAITQVNNVKQFCLDRFEYTDLTLIY